jgi:hypothetical protein
MTNWAPRPQVRGEGDADNYAKREWPAKPTFAADGAYLRTPYIRANWTISSQSDDVALTIHP